MRPEPDDLYYRLLVPLEDISILPIPTNQIPTLSGLLAGDSPAGRLISAELIAGVDRDRQTATYLLVSYLDRYDRSTLRLIKTGQPGDALQVAFQPQLAWDPAA